MPKAAIATTPKNEVRIHLRGCTFTGPSYEAILQGAREVSKGLMAGNGGPSATPMAPQKRVMRRRGPNVQKASTPQAATTEQTAPQAQGKRGGRKKQQVEKTMTAGGQQG